MVRRVICMLTYACILASSTGFAQDSSYSIFSAGTVPTTTLSKLQRRYASLSDDIDKRSSAALKTLQRQEIKLRTQIAYQDSGRAATLFDESSLKYQQLQDKIKAREKGILTTAGNYMPGLDSMETALRLLEKSGINLPPGKLDQLQELSQQLKNLQSSFTHASAVENFVKEREQALASQLPGLATGGQLLSINKEVYYYREQLGQYRDIVNKPDRLQQSMLSIVGRLPAFQQYWQQYSLLAQLFPVPANYGTPEALNGLQTIAQVTGLVQQRMGLNLPSATTVDNSIGAGNSSSAIPDQYIQQAQNQLGQMKEKITQAGGTNSGMTVPNFTPDSQHGKRFLRHLTYGFNIQTASASTYLPSITDFAVTIGYKVNDKIQMGIGASYKLGMGKLPCIQFSNEGAGARSYLDIKAKSSIWITGGWEYNYLQRFNSLQELHKKVTVWQKSALLGLTKKYSIAKKEGNIQLLYDMLAGRQRPVGQSFKFRTGVYF